MGSLVSVIIPTWNRSNTILRAIESVTKQTYKDIEIIICDDGSTDNTRELIKSLGDDRIKIVSLGHSGKPSIARNRGISQAKGEWLAFLDSDDEWLETKLEKQIKAMERLRMKASSTNALRIVEGKSENEEFIFWNRRKITFNNLLAYNLVISSSAMFHRSLLAEVKGYPEDMTVSEDYALWLRVATLSSFAFVKECLVKYYDEPKTSIRKKNLSIRESKRIVFENFRHWAEKKAERRKYANRISISYLLQLPVFNLILANALKKLTR